MNEQKSALSFDFQFELKRKFLVTNLPYLTPTGCKTACQVFIEFLEKYEAERKQDGNS